VRPRDYCEQTIDELRLPPLVGPSPRFPNADRWQVFFVLIHFSRLDPSPNEFEAGLRRLIKGPQQGGRSDAARASQAILDDWQQARRGVGREKAAV
jgi:hypothetical protein